MVAAPPNPKLDPPMGAAALKEEPNAPGAAPGAAAAPPKPPNAVLKYKNEMFSQISSTHSRFSVARIHPEALGQSARFC